MKCSRNRSGLLICDDSVGDLPISEKMNQSNSPQTTLDPNILIQMQTSLANSVHPIEIHLHLTSGRKHIFTQSDLGFAKKICDDLNASIFKEQSLIIEGKDEIYAFAGHTLIGITVYTDPLPDSFLKHEMDSKAKVTQITHNMHRERRERTISTVEGERCLVLSEVEFCNGARLFLEFNEVTAIAIDERSTMHHLFTHPALMCRVNGGFSIWSTSHMCSWTHYPKLHIPINSWVADAAPKDLLEDLQNVKFL